MARAAASDPQTENRLLARLPRTDCQRLLGQAQLVPLEFKQVLIEPRQPLAHVYFPTRGVVGLLAASPESEGTEVASIGRDGLVGINVFWGSETLPFRAMVQLAGEAWRLPADGFRELARKNAGLADVLGRYTNVVFTQLAQSVACNGLHNVRQRCCRWLLATHDRVGSANFSLTQGFLAEMLGVRRASVAETARTLQDEGLIKYRWGKLSITDRRGLESAACECYRLVKQESERLMG